LKNTFPEDVLKVSTEFRSQKLISVPDVKEEFKDDQGYKIVRNCDLFEKGTVSRERSEKGNLYSASNGGTACDYFYYSTIDNSKPVALRIKGKNLEGRLTGTP